ncbi:MAG: hydrogenase maturation protease, partial [Lentisphaerae bacterium]|nr:hydrogenase maturation protease [Lentisphaerota bacterium]
MKKIVVIGLGNTLMSDEGVGIHLLHRLKARASGFPGVDFVDLGASGLRLVHALAGRKRAILLDCARMGETPGTIRRFTPEEVRTGKKLPGFSLHEGDVLQAIALSRTLGECPESIVVFGIQP